MVDLMNELIEVSRGTKIISRIENLPTALLRFSIFNYLTDDDVYSLSKTSHAMDAEYKAPLLEKLLSHVVKGEEKKALQMIDAHPTLLLHASKANDYSGRLYKNYTPFQAALLCHDVWLWTKMEPYFDRLPDGQMEKERQFNALFPTGIHHGTPYDFSALIQAITHSSTVDIEAVLQNTQNDTALCNAFNHFRNNFKALAMEETFFNPSHLIRALKIHDEQFDNWSWAQRNLFWRQVIGYTIRFFPACLAQACNQGLYNIVENRDPLYRLLKFGFSFPLVESSGLGFDFGILSIRTGFPLASGLRGGGTHGKAVNKLFRATTSELIRLEYRVNRAGESITNNETLPSRSCCTIS
jgi:hypothetical protein